MRKTAFAQKVLRQLRRVVVIAGVLATLGVTAVQAQAATNTFPDQTIGQQSSWSGPSFDPAQGLQSSWSGRSLGVTHGPQSSWSAAWFGRSGVRFHIIGHKLLA